MDMRIGQTLSRPIRNVDSASPDLQTLDQRPVPSPSPAPPLRDCASPARIRSRPVSAAAFTNPSAVSARSPAAVSPSLSVSSTSSAASSSSKPRRFSLRRLGAARRSIGDAGEMDDDELSRLHSASSSNASSVASSALTPSVADSSSRGPSPRPVATLAAPPSTGAKGFNRAVHSPRPPEAVQSELPPAFRRRHGQPSSIGNGRPRINNTSVGRAAGKAAAAGGPNKPMRRSSLSRLPPVVAWGCDSPTTATAPPANSSNSNSNSNSNSSNTVEVPALSIIASSPQSSSAALPLPLPSSVIVPTTASLGGNTLPPHSPRQARKVPTKVVIASPQARRASAAAEQAFASDLLAARAHDEAGPAFVASEPEELECKPLDGSADLADFVVEAAGLLSVRASNEEEDDDDSSWMLEDEVDEIEASVYSASEDEEEDVGETEKAKEEEQEEDGLGPLPEPVAVAPAPEVPRKRSVSFSPQLELVHEFDKHAAIRRASSLSQLVQHTAARAASQPRRALALSMAVLVFTLLLIAGIGLLMAWSESGGGGDALEGGEGSGAASYVDLMASGLIKAVLCFLGALVLDKICQF